MMESYDLIIRGGTILDGSGGDPFEGDIAVRDGSIAAVGRISGSGRDEIDATGRLVTPGFVDIHTHYDGQVTWENRLRPSSEHGVTTVVMGNCGVGFAPCKPDERDLLVRVMEGVEDIPEIVLTEGIPWTWTSYPEYLDFLAGRRFDADCAAYVPHAALRVFVMGERAIDREPATAEDRDRMCELVSQAVLAGALGVSSSRLLSHRDSAGNLAPHVMTDRDELMALAEGLRRAGKGVFQIAAGFSNQQLGSVIEGASTTSPEKAARDEVDLLAELCRASGRPVTFALAIINAMPELATLVLDLVGEANREPGVEIAAQVFPRPVGILFGLDLSLHPFKLHPSYRAIEHLPLNARVAEMHKPEVRARILGDKPDADHPDPIQRFLVERSLLSYPFGREPDYEPLPGSSLAAVAERGGRSIEDIAYAALLEDDGKALLFLPINNFPGSLDQLAEMIESDHTVIGLGDGGAHLGLICDASYPTFLLSYWTRERTRGNRRRISLQQAVRQLTRRAAEVVGLNDRGLLAPGLRADINIIDYGALRLHGPDVSCDLPGDGKRLSQRVDGIVATIVAGEVTYRNGAPTGALPGRLLRCPEPVSTFSE